MWLPRIQFRLWMIFAVMALVGWAIVAVPYWFAPVATDVESYQEFIALNEEAAIKMPIDAAREYGLWQTTSGRVAIYRDRSAVLIWGLIAAVTLAACLADYRFRRVPKKRAGDNRPPAG